ncbi:Pimeloyl-ACP methyl ester carboxylesterase [Solimonas aquatica]|uniref:Pimeloyl-ACP methyl ester carboxylesterase n=1 Tax=Solimonas aquatica TaxID=489703 RepID=A0A1H9CWG6_9GAMM|nr:alpha/beta hydrolase [Solimonas aquatica]SEQ05560.1 Pimeloyl-ACP methyl ester carboxylesterase [Solimonas aquatica]
MLMTSVPGAQLATMTLGHTRNPPLVMLHGLVLGNMASWFSSIASPLADEHYVVLYDQRGHGSSTPAARGYDLDSQADDLQAVIEGLQLPRVPDLVGHSMGALIALRYALRHPARVRRLVLVDAPMPASQHVAPSLGNASPEALKAYLDSQLLGLSGRRRERQRQRLEALLGSSLVQDVQQMGPEDDAQLAQLKIPVLLVYGRHSPCLSAGEHLRAVLPNVQSVLLDCGHYITEEAPQALLAALREFLDES